MKKNGKKINPRKKQRSRSLEKEENKVRQVNISQVTSLYISEDLRYKETHCHSQGSVLMERGKQLSGEGLRKKVWKVEPRRGS